jgi:hypothetical protein
MYSNDGDIFAKEIRKSFNQKTNELLPFSERWGAYSELKK